jgi:hypothetical protein
VITVNTAAPDHYETIATSLLYLDSQFELASMNTYGSLVVHVNVGFITASHKWRRIISSNCVQ